MYVRIEVRSRHDNLGAGVVSGAAALGMSQVTGCQTARLYFLSHDPGTESLHRLCAFLLADPVVETARWQLIDPDGRQEAAATGAGHAVEVSYRPGVTDIPARELAKGMVEIGLPRCDVATGIRYDLAGELSGDEVRALARKLLCNATVQHYALGPIAPPFGIDEEVFAGDQIAERIEISRLGDDALQALSKRRLLSLDLAEMRTIQSFYRALGRNPTDVELETLAQTWSEHCVHKTFKAKIHFTWRNADGTLRQEQVIDGLLRDLIKKATDTLNPPWLRSAFVDNAGIIEFDETYDLAFKVETHNHPSALEPFGGANTGVGGVVRDISGVSARPIATTDVLCFGPQDFPNDQVPDGVLHPRRIAAGVVAGIGDYGNKLGLPTVNGAVIYDEGYLGNPLVFCGCAGLLPHGKHPTQSQRGDLIVALGGRTGRDGIHGATFSSAELSHDTHETAGSAVQNGDPITEKGLIEVVELARDRGLYTAITDCGAGGFSSAVGEMGEKLGVEVELTNAPLKYAGLTPWEIWISEAQERLVLAVPPAHLAEMQALCDLWDVELSVLGHFTGDGDLHVKYAGRTVAQLPMAFLHDGLPRRSMSALYQEPAANEGAAPVELHDPTGILLQMLSHPSIASKEAIVRRYDHEVRGGTLVRPFTGPQMDGPADAAVLKPLGTWHHSKAFALSNGINPLLGKRDPYAMAVSAVDEAVRNAVAVGADPDRIAILDNFCWGNPTLPDRLGTLVRTCQGCYDAAMEYRTPFISGKDSLFNEFNGKPIPGTLLISAIAIVPEMERATTSHLKQPGNRLYLLGETRPELGGSLLHHLLDIEDGTAPQMPPAPLNRYRLLHQAIRAGWVQSAHDCSEGGVAVALAEMALGGRLGASVDLPGSDVAAVALFAESNGRLLLEVRPEDAGALEAHFAAETLQAIGTVTAAQQVMIRHGGRTVIVAALPALVQAFQTQP